MNKRFSIMIDVIYNEGEGFVYSTLCPFELIKNVREVALTSFVFVHITAACSLSCPAADKCELGDPEKLKWIQKHLSCGICGEELDLGYVILLARARNYLPRGFLPLCCSCYETYDGIKLDVEVL